MSRPTMDQPLPQDPPADGIVAECLDCHCALREEDVHQVLGAAYCLQCGGVQAAAVAASLTVGYDDLIACANTVELWAKEIRKRAKERTRLERSHHAAVAAKNEAARRAAEA